MAWKASSNCILALTYYRFGTGDWHDVSPHWTPQLSNVVCSPERDDGCRQITKDFRSGTDVTPVNFVVQIYDCSRDPHAAAVDPVDALRRLARITSSSSLLFAGFWKNAVAPASKLRSSLPSGPRPAATTPGMFESVSLSRDLLSTE